jgi:hypothetical protein
MFNKEAAVTKAARLLCSFVEAVVIPLVFPVAILQNIVL